eukprot:scaffold731_cov261-Pinguiococcus_pyrenoidosus.AAC.28
MRRSGRCSGKRRKPQRQLRRRRDARIPACFWRAAKTGDDLVCADGHRNASTPIREWPSSECAFRAA